MEFEFFFSLSIVDKYIIYMFFKILKYVAFLQLNLEFIFINFIKYESEVLNLIGGPYNNIYSIVGR